VTRRLLEEGLPFDAINEASHREKAGNAPSHPRRLHLWWARRPLAMSRAIVLGALVPAPESAAAQARVFDAIAGASLFKDSAVQARVAPLRELVQTAFPDAPPRVLDCYAGGGAIPLEALRLGCDVTAIDLNPVATLIELCMLNYPQRYAAANEAFGRDLISDFRRWAAVVAGRTEARVRQMFQQGDGTAPRPVVWFWARTMQCQNPHCSIRIPLTTSWWLAKGRRRVALQTSMHDGELSVELLDAFSEGQEPAPGTVRASSVTCPQCGTTTHAEGVREYGRTNGFGARLLAVLEVRDGQRVYRLPHDGEEGLAGKASDVLANLRDADDGTTAIPDERLSPDQYRKFGGVPFGATFFRDLFTPRQLSVAGILCEENRRAHAEMIAEGIPDEYAKALATYIGLTISRTVDYNSACCIWETSGEFVAHTFGRQAIPMVWDFAEIDPFAPISGNWEGGVDAVAGAIASCASTGSISAHVRRGNAQDLADISDESFDAVVVDPPYYDAMQYADLSDYFYVWLKRSVGSLYPALFATPLTPKDQEVIENRADKRSASYISAAEFETRLARSLKEMRRVVKPEGVVVVVFAHTDADAWERLLRALLDADLVVSTSWPMKSEKAGRSTANIGAVLGSSVVIVCRPRLATERAFYDDVVRDLDVRIGARLEEFERLGLHGADYLISAIGPAFEVFGRYSEVVRLSGEAVSVGDLLALARRTVASHAMQRLLGSEDLATLDEITLFYLTWRWAYGAEAIPVDEAQKLGKAFRVDVTDHDGPDGLVAKKGSNYVLNGADVRRKIALAASPAIIDVLQLACRVHDSGRRREAAELLGATGLAQVSIFWASARAIAECLPDGNRERTMLVNFLGGRDGVVEAAAQSTTALEELRLFEVT
jgi:putative DNA methylase